MPERCEFYASGMCTNKGINALRTLSAGAKGTPIGKIFNGELACALKLEDDFPLALTPRQHEAIDILKEAGCPGNNK